MTQNILKFTPQIYEITATLDSSSSINHDLKQKSLGSHRNLLKCTPTVENMSVSRVATLIFIENKMAVGHQSLHKTWLQDDHLYTDSFNFGNSTTRFCNATFFVCKIYFGAEFAAKHAKAPLTLTSCWNMELFWLIKVIWYIAFSFL